MLPAQESQFLNCLPQQAIFLWDLEQVGGVVESLLVALPGNWLPHIREVRLIPSQHCNLVPNYLLEWFCEQQCIFWHFECLSTGFVRIYPRVFLTKESNWKADETVDISLHNFCWIYVYVYKRRRWRNENKIFRYITEMWINERICL